MNATRSPASLLVAVSVALAAPARAADDAPKAGPIYFVNRTDAELTLKARYAVDADGAKAPLAYVWKVKPGQQGYLIHDGKKLAVRELGYTLTTADGSSDWVMRGAVLDGDGDVVVVLTEARLAEHKKLTGARPEGQDKAALTARRSKQAWDEMGRVDARTAPLAARNALAYWEAFTTGYGLIDKDDVDPDLVRLIRDWVAVSADYHATQARYERARDSLARQIDRLGPCPDEAGPAFLWGLALGALTGQVRDLDAQHKAALAALTIRKGEVERREAEVGRALASRYPAHQFSR